MWPVPFSCCRGEQVSAERTPEPAPCSSVRAPAELWSRLSRWLQPPPETQPLGLGGRGHDAAPRGPIPPPSSRGRPPTAAWGRLLRGRGARRWEPETRCQWPWRSGKVTVQLTRPPPARLNTCLLYGPQREREQEHTPTPQGCGEGTSLIKLSADVRGLPGARTPLVQENVLTKKIGCECL